MPTFPDPITERTAELEAGLDELEATSSGLELPPEPEPVAPVAPPLPVEATRETPPPVPVAPAFDPRVDPMGLMAPAPVSTGDDMLAFDPPEISSGDTAEFFNLPPTTFDPAAPRAAAPTATWEEIKSSEAFSKASYTKQQTALRNYTLDVRKHLLDLDGSNSTDVDDQTTAFFRAEGEIIGKRADAQLAKENPEFTRYEKMVASMGAEVVSAVPAMKNMLDYVNVGFYTVTDALLGTNVAEGFSTRIAERGKKIAENRALGAEASGQGVLSTLGAGTAQQIMMLPATLFPPGLMARIGFGVKGAITASSAIGGLQSASDSFSSNIADRIEKGQSVADAARAEFLPSIASGLITATITKGFGATGVESIFKQEGGKIVMGKLRETVKQAGFEMLEETTDEAGQILNDLANNRQVSIADAVKRLGTAAALSGILGGGVSGLHLALSPEAGKQMNLDLANADKLQREGLTAAAQAQRETAREDFLDSIAALPPLPETPTTNSDEISITPVPEGESILSKAVMVDGKPIVEPQMVGGEPEVKAESTTGLGELGGDAVVDGMYDTMFDKLQKGDLTEGGQPSPSLAKANVEFQAGNIKTPADLKAFFNPTEGGEVANEQNSKDGQVSDQATPAAVSQEPTGQDGDLLTESGGGQTEPATPTTLTPEQQRQWDQAREETAATEAAKAGPPKVGSVTKLLGADATLAEHQTSDQNVRYEIYNTGKQEAVIRVVDADTGNNVSLTKYPKFDQAAAAYTEALKSEGLTPGNLVNKPKDFGIKATEDNELTPAHKNFLALKQADPGKLHLVKMGDFYEAFGDDAKALAKTANIALTSRKGVPMAGVPYHAIDRYRADLVAAGHSVAFHDDFLPKPTAPQKPVAAKTKNSKPGLTSSAVNDVANSTATDLDKALRLPKGATAIRVTPEQGGKKIVFKKGDLTGVNPMHEAGPWKSVEAGTIAQGGKFTPMKAEIGLRMQLDDEANLDVANENEESVYEENPTKLSDEDAANSLPSTDSETSLGSSTKAWVTSTHAGVAEALRAKGTDPATIISKTYAPNGWNEDSAAHVAATVENAARKFPNNPKSFTERAMNRVQRDMLDNIEDTGNPLLVTKRNGEIANYNPYLVASREIGNDHNKIGTREVESRDRLNAEGETVHEEAPEAITRDASPTRDQVATAEAEDIKTSFAEHLDKTWTDFSADKNNHLEGATAAQTLKAAKLMLDDFSGASQAKENAPKKKKASIRTLEDRRGVEEGDVVDRLMNNPEFQQLFKEQVLNPLVTFATSKADKGDILFSKEIHVGIADAIAQHEHKQAIDNASAKLQDGLPLNVVVAAMPEAIRAKVATVTARFGLDQGINHALGEIAKGPANTPEAQLLRTLASALSTQGDNAPVNVDPTLETRRNAAAEFIPRTGSVSVSPFLSDLGVAKGVVHEKTHVLLYNKTAAYLRGDHTQLSSADIGTLNEVMALRETLLAHADVPESVRQAAKAGQGEKQSLFDAALKEDGGSKKFYGLIDPHEMFTALLGDKRFQEFANSVRLDGTPASSKSTSPTIWAKLKQLMRNLLFNGKPVAEGSALARGFDLTVDLLASGQVKGRTNGNALQAPAETPTDTPEFKQWFGDSKAVDREGKPLVLYHGSDQARDTFDGGHFFTDSKGDASAYAEMKALDRAMDNNDALNEIVSEILTEEGGDSVSDLGPKRIREIAEANNIPLEAGKGHVGSVFLKVENPLDLTEHGSDVGNVKALWDDLHDKGLLDQPWAELDEDAQWEVKDDYKDMALYRFLEKEGIQAKAFDKGFDAVMFTDMSPDGGTAHTSWLTKDNTQVKSATDNSGAFDPNDPNILRSPSDSFDIAKYEGQKQRRFLTDFASGHGYASSDALAVSDPALYNQALEMHTATHEGDMVGFRMATEDEEVQGDTAKYAKKLFAEVDKRLPGQSSEEIVAQALNKGASTAEEFADAFHEAGMDPQMALAVGNAVESHFQFAASDKAAEIATERTAKRETLVKDQRPIGRGDVLGITANIKPFQWLANNTARLFKAEGNVPKEVFERWMDREGEVKALGRDIEYTTRDLYTGLQEAFGIGKIERFKQGFAGVPKEFVTKMNAALLGEVPMSSMPEQVRGPLIEMRAQIDRLSQKMIDEGLATGDLEATLAENIGVYLTRSYRIFDDPEWATKIPIEVRNKARAYLGAQMIADRASTVALAQLGMTKAAAKKSGQYDAAYAAAYAKVKESFDPAEANREMESMLQDWKDQGDQRGTGGKLGAKDLSIFKARKDIPEALRALMGEYHNPVVNYARSVTKMAALLGNNSFLTDIKAMGMGKWLFEKGTEPKGFSAKIAADGASVYSKGSRQQRSTTMSPLNGLRTTPEIAEAFADFNKTPGTPGTAFKLYMGLTAAAKGAKTVGSGMTQARNLFGQVYFFGMNGHFNLSTLKDGVMGTLADTGFVDSPEWRGFYKRMTELGVVNQSTKANELRDTLKDAGLNDADLDEFGQHRLAKNLYGVSFGAAIRAYQISDDLGKIVGFHNERSRQAKINPDWNDAQLDAEAAKRIRLTYPTYSMVPEWVKQFRRQPVIGPFMTFAYETFRTTGHSINFMAQDLANTKNPAAQRAGMARLVGQLGVLAGGYALSAASRALLGMLPEEEEDVRKFLPTWDKNAQLLFTGKGDGTLSYINISYANPYSYLMDPITAVISGVRSEDKILEILGKSFGELMRPFVSESILAGVLINLARNQTPTGRRVYNPQDTWDVKSAAVLAHIGTAIEPGTSTRIRKNLIPAFKGEVSGSGQKRTPTGEIVAELTGYRVATIDFRQAVGRSGSQFKKEEKDSEDIFRDVALRQGTVKDAEIVDAYNRSDRSRFALWKDLHDTMIAASRRGVPLSETRKLLQARGLSKKDADLIGKGTYVPYAPTKAMTDLLKTRKRKLPPLTSLFAKRSLADASP